MIGAIIGDIAGSRFEFNNTHDYNFQIFHPDCNYTDDTICSVAVADAILRDIDYKDSLLYWCRKYPCPMGAYGGSFSRWIHSANPQPYNSFGNGAAMRVSPVAWAFNSEPDVIRQAMMTALPSHNHPDGIIGASAVALLIFYNRQVRDRSNCDVICDDMMTHYYGAHFNWKSNLPKPGVFDETCQGCVPLAWEIAKDSRSFEDAIRNAVAYGGDSDTLGAIVGSIAEARFGVPVQMQKVAMNMLPADMLKVVVKFIQKYQH
ncbi:MAG: ADP-ribosylglycohydrolase family protein [Bacteroides sp.]|nr:ADP-ribosylglycohydrolase family protein [Bacteroides sp.]